MKDYKNNLSLVTDVIPSSLHASIMLGIKNEARRSARIRFAVKSLITCVSAFVFVVSAKSLISEASASGFFEYVSLMFTDISTSWVYSKELVFAIIDVIPFLGIASISVALALGVWSFVKSLPDARVAFLTA